MSNKLPDIFVGNYKLTLCDPFGNEIDPLKPITTEMIARWRAQDKLNSESGHFEPPVFKDDGEG